MRIFKSILKWFLAPLIAYSDAVKSLVESIKRGFCNHCYDYRDVILKCDGHRHIDGTVFHNYYRRCGKCGKSQRARKTPGDWGTWVNISDMDFTKYPPNKKIEQEVSLNGEPSARQKRKNKLDKLLKESTT